jgi:DNA-binding NarL/FixJ family response regulator
MTINVFLADDHKIMRDGLRLLLEKNGGMNIVGEACDGRSTVELVSRLRPDVIVVDVEMPGLNGIDATSQILGANPSAKVVALSSHSDQHFVLKMLKAGASGYLLKTGAFDELAKAIKTVSSGQTYLSPAIAGIVVQNSVRKSAPAFAAAKIDLSAREREVLQLLAEGQSTKQIAASLSVSAKTIETHRRTIMEKLDIHSVAELTKYAIRQGLTGLEA